MRGRNAKESLATVSTRLLDVDGCRQRLCGRFATILRGAPSSSSIARIGRSGGSFPNTCRCERNEVSLVWFTEEMTRFMAGAVVTSDQT